MNKVKAIYEKILNKEIDTNQITMGNLIRKFNIDNPNVMIIKKEIECKFEIEVNNMTKIENVIDHPFLYLKKYLLMKD